MAIYALCLLAGVVIHRWRVLLLPLTVLSLLYGSPGQGWWGSGLGDAWQLAVTLVLAGGLAAAGFGVILGRVVSRLSAGHGDR